jgi:hypothetical protein
MPYAACKMPTLLAGVEGIAPPVHLAKRFGEPPYWQVEPAAVMW